MYMCMFQSVSLSLVFSGGLTDHCSQEDTGEEVTKKVKKTHPRCDITRVPLAGKFVESYRRAHV